LNSRATLLGVEENESTQIRGRIRKGDGIVSTLLIIVLLLLLLGGGGGFYGYRSYGNAGFGGALGLVLVVLVVLWFMGVFTGLPPIHS